MGRMSCSHKRVSLAGHRGIEPLLLDLESNVLPLTLMTYTLKTLARIELHIKRDVEIRVIIYIVLAQTKEVAIN